MHDGTHERQPAGWYPDPAGHAPWRWWDGSKWTERTTAVSNRPSAARKQRSAAVRVWWQERGWWKSPAAVFIGLTIIGSIGNAVDPVEQRDDAPTQMPASQTKRVPKPASVVIRRAMITRRGEFWMKQPRSAKLALVGYCLGYAKRSANIIDDAGPFVSRLDRVAVAGKIDRFYVDKQRFFGGTNADEPITTPCNDAAETMSERLATTHRKALEASVEPRRFRATSKLVRRWYKINEQEEDLRSVSCSHRTTCTVAVNAVVGDLGVIGDLVVGEYNRDYEAQFVFPITELFHRLFGDPKFQRGSVTAWLEVQTQGGKNIKAPAVTVTCDRAADEQIDWDNVLPDGLRRYCDCDLRSVRGIG